MLNVRILSRPVLKRFADGDSGRRLVGYELHVF
jgi:hypothetical protein